MTGIGGSPLVPGRILELSTELAQPSPIYFGSEIESQLVDRLARHAFDRLFLLAEEPILDLIGGELVEALQSSFDCQVMLLPTTGEQSKRFPVLEQTCESLVEEGVSKSSLLLAFGGGAVGNIVGLVSGLVYRGIRYVEIPTTMTGQTDSTLSNKQAVNGRRGKNHFGLYHRPLFIWSDVAYLRTEPPSARRGGLVEAVKNAFISDATFLDDLEAVLDPSARYDDATLGQLALAAIRSKLVIIRRDPSEKAEGIILEYGHTFGHAIEWLMRGAMTHGEAVALGMLLAADVAHELGLIDRELVARHTYLLAGCLGMDLEFPRSIDADQLIAAMENDNKRTGGDLRFVLLDGAGSCYNPEGDFLVTVDRRLVTQVVRRFIARHRRR